MKTLHSITAVMIVSSLLISLPSCVVRHDNGLHKGWYKNSNNPHNPNSTNPGKGNGNGNGNGKVKSKGKH